MKANRKFVEGEEAVSAVIGVILMVAITVAIAATVYVYVSGMLGGGVQQTPTVGVSKQTSDLNATISITSITDTGIPWTDVAGSIVNLDTGGVAAWSDDTDVVSTDTGSDDPGTIICDINIIDDGDTYIGGGDIIQFGYNAGDTNDDLVDGNEYQVTIKYEPTGGTMGTVSWTQ